MDEDEMRTFSSHYLQAIPDMEKERKEIDHVLRVHAESGYIFHSIVPKIDNGETIGYHFIFEDTYVD